MEKKLKIREEAIGKLTKKKKKKGKQKMEREKNEWNEECKSERRLFQSTIFKEGGGRQRRKNRRHVFFQKEGNKEKHQSIKILLGQYFSDLTLQTITRGYRYNADCHSVGLPF